MILSFHKQPGAFVDREYPKGITKDMGIDATDQNKIYSLHRMRNTRPNYLFLKAKNITIASYFSGFDLRQYLGRPNQCVSVILDNSENPTIWEGQLRRLTFELLPLLAEVRGDELIMTGLSTDSKYVTFDRKLSEYFEDLKAGRIQPLEEGEGEVLVGDGAKVDTISDSRESTNTPKSMIGTHQRESSLTAEDIIKATTFAKAQNQTESVDPMVLASQQMENMEKESLRNEIRKMHEMLSNKTNQIRALESQLHDAKENACDAVDIARIRGEYEAIISSKDEELDTWRNKVAELNENNFINQDNIMKLNEMTMMQTDEMQNQSRMIMDLKKQIKTLEENQNPPKDSSSDELLQLKAHVIEVEENLKEKITELENQKEKNKTLFFQIKDLQTQNAQYAQLIEQNTNQSAELTQLRQNLENSNEKIKSLEEKIEHNHTQNDALMGIELVQNEGLNPEIQSLKTELMHLKKTIKVQEKEIENLKKIAGLN